jgi:hypothetical protein
MLLRDRRVNELDIGRMDVKRVSKKLSQRRVSQCFHILTSSAPPNLPRIADSCSHRNVYLHIVIGNDLEAVLERSNFAQIPCSAQWISIFLLELKFCHFTHPNLILYH